MADTDGRYSTFSPNNITPEDVPKNEWEARGEGVAEWMLDRDILDEDRIGNPQAEEGAEHGIHGTRGPTRSPGVRLPNMMLLPATKAITGYHSRKSRVAVVGST